MATKKNFLILISDSGFGHRSAANAVAKAMRMQHPDDSVTAIINPILDEPGTPLLKISEHNYDQLATNHQNFYRFAYEVSDSRPFSSLVEGTITVELFHNLKQTIQELQPNAILSTNQMFSEPTGVVINTMEKRPPFYTVVTDLATVHAMWFNDRPDRFFVASDVAQARAIECGIDPEKILISGIPVDPAFTTNQTVKPELRVKLGLDPQLPTLLFVGSRRVSGIFEHLQALESLSLPFQVVLITGGDQEVFDQVSQRPWNFPLQIHNYVTNMPEWMLCADLLVTKAGGLILSEGLAAGLPILLIDNLPGQEEGNVRFVLDHQAGSVAKDPQELSAHVHDWLTGDQEILKGMAAQARSCGHPDAAMVIAEALWQADEMQVPITSQRLPPWKYLERRAKQVNGER